MWLCCCCGCCPCGRVSEMVHGALARMRRSLVGMVADWVRRTHRPADHDNWRTLRAADHVDGRAHRIAHFEFHGQSYYFHKHPNVRTHVVCCSDSRSRSVLVRPNGGYCFESRVDTAFNVRSDACFFWWGCN